MFSQFFILNERGSTVVFKEFRNDISEDSPEILNSYLRKKLQSTQLPIFSSKGIHFALISEVSGLLFVLASKMISRLPLLFRSWKACVGC